MDIMGVFSDQEKTSEAKKKEIYDIKIPFEKSGHQSEDEKRRARKCERDRRNLFGVLTLDDNPLNAYQCFNLLYSEEKDLKFAVNRFYAKLKYLEVSRSKSDEYQYALSEWEDAIKASNATVIKLNSPSLQNWFNCLHQLQKHKDIDALWLQCTDVQKNDADITKIHCQSLIDRGDNLTARKVLENFKLHHQIANWSDDIGEILSEIEKKLLSEQDHFNTMTLTRQILAKPCTNDDLRRYYQEIKSKKLDAYISITEPDNPTIENFLYTGTINILNELVLRKNNLQKSKSDNQAVNVSERIQNEDLINDWFTSIFDRQYAYMGLSCRDQKRGGQSPSAENPGEIDFFICDGRNERIAILEAFRLFSLDNETITKHLDKIAGYDQECNSPVIFLIYCDVVNFSSLCNKYKNDINSREYIGFIKPSNGYALNQTNISEGLIVFKELRYRGNIPIILFHFMINLRFV